MNVYLNKIMSNYNNKNVCWVKYKFVYVMIIVCIFI
jgi:hypothetical protein